MKTKTQNGLNLVLILGMFSLLLALAGSVQAASTIEGQTIQSAEKKLTPMMKEIKEVFSAKNQRLADLGKQAKSADDATEMMAIQREISKVKFAMEVSVLKIQADYARQDGHSDLAAQIDEVIKSMGQTAQKSAVSIKRTGSTNNSEKN